MSNELIPASVGVPKTGQTQGRVRATSSQSEWHVPEGTAWVEKAGRASSACWDYFRVEVPTGEVQGTHSEIICVHKDHDGKRVVVKAPSNTSNLHKHLQIKHGFVIEGTRGSSSVSAYVPDQDKTDSATNPENGSGTSGPVLPAGDTTRKTPVRARKRNGSDPIRDVEPVIGCVAHPRISSVAPSAASAHGAHVSGQRHEDDVAAVVVVCAPSLSKTMGALHPAGALYARPVHINQAREAHGAFVSLLRRRGIEVHDVREILQKDSDWNLGARCKLEDLAAKSLSYVMAEGAAGTSGELTEHYVSDAYKRSVLAEMDVSQLVDIVMTNPTVTITNTGRDTGFSAQYSFCPSTNIMFTRDQQVTTVNGVVMARLQATQRRQEVDILEFCLRKLGVKVLGRVEKGFLEGGDFFPCGREMCIVGIGPRSTYEAVEWMMEEDMFGTETVVVVRDELDMSQDRMHLDCIFNIVSPKCCILAENCIGERVPDKKRIVDVWKKGQSRGPHQHGQYSLVKKSSGVEFSAFLKSSGFTIIPVSAEEQLLYGCNVLNLGNGQIISTERNSARRIATEPAFTGTVEYLEYSAVTAMFGGVHCSSQVVSRTPMEHM